MSNSRNRTFIVGLIIAIIGFCFYMRGIIPVMLGIIPALFVVVADFVQGIGWGAFDNGMFIAIGFPVMALGVFLVIRGSKLQMLNRQGIGADHST